MHWCVARTKVIEILPLMYPHILDLSCCHFFVRRLAIIFRIDPASTPSIPSTEATKGENVDISEGRHPGTSFLLPYLPHEDTSRVSLINGIYCKCSQHACREHFRFNSYRCHISEGCPSVLWPLAFYLIVVVFTPLDVPLASAWHDM